MKDCPYNNSCIKSICDFSCSEFSELSHWLNRCDLKINNPVFKADISKIVEANSILKLAEEDENTDSSYIHIGVYSGEKSQLVADLTTYVAICKYCKNIGFYNGVYKLNYAKYLEEIKQSWNTRYTSSTLEDMKIWIKSSKYLIVYNLGLVRFGDFESQTLLSIFQERYDQNKYTILILDNGKFSLPGKLDSMFYAKLKHEIASRGVKL